MALRLLIIQLFELLCSLFSILPTLLECTVTRKLCKCLHRFLKRHEPCFVNWTLINENVIHLNIIFVKVSLLFLGNITKSKIEKFSVEGINVSMTTCYSTRWHHRYESSQFNNVWHNIDYSLLKWQSTEIYRRLFR